MPIHARAACLVLSLAAALAAAGEAAAQGGGLVGQSGSLELGRVDREVVLQPQVSDFLRLPRPARTILLGDPTIADATLDSESVLVLTGQRVGVTNLIIVDAEGREVIRAALRVRPRDGRVVVRHGTGVQGYSCSPLCAAD